MHQTGKKLTDRFEFGSRCTAKRSAGVGVLGVRVRKIAEGEDMLRTASTQPV